MTKIWTRTLASAALTTLFTLSVGSAGHAKCFDWDAGVPKPLKTPVSYGGKKEISKAGTNHKKKFIWGYARGKVEKPILKVYELLLDHYTIKDPEKVKLRMYDQPKPGYLAFHLLMVSVKKVPVAVGWEENWAYSLLEGTPESPKKILIQNQKEVGSDFLRHLCGTIVLEADSENVTDVFVYEELDALGKRTETDTRKGHLGTLKTLRTR